MNLVTAGLLVLMMIKWCDFSQIGGVSAFPNLHLKPALETLGRKVGLVGNCDHTTAAKAHILPPTPKNFSKNIIIILQLIS